MPAYLRRWRMRTFLDTAFRLRHADTPLRHDTRVSGVTSSRINLPHVAASTRAMCSKRLRREASAVATILTLIQ